MENCANCKHHDVFWGGSGCVLLNGGERCKYEPNDETVIRELREKLERYEKAEQEGRLVELPCEVGRTVYTLFCGKVVEKRIGQWHVNGYTNPRIWADIDCDWTTTQSVRWDLAVGKTVFMTREEAEAALKGMK